MWNHYYYHVDLPKIRFHRVHTAKNLSYLCPIFHLYLYIAQIVLKDASASYESYIAANKKGFPCVFVLKLKSYFCNPICHVSVVLGNWRLAIWSRPAQTCEVHLKYYSFENFKKNLGNHPCCCLLSIRLQLWAFKVGIRLLFMKISQIEL